MISVWRNRLFPAVVAALLAGVAVGSAYEYADVQTYCMLPLDPERAVEKGITVNGLWAGFGMPEAVRSSTHLVSGTQAYPPEWRYPTIKDYVDAMHDVGVLVPATLMGIAGHPLLRERFPEMELGACRGVDGGRSYWSRDGDRSYFMCSNNPIYNEVLLTIGTEAIDAGADVIVIDELLGNEAAFYWDNQAGFCDHCLAAYRTHLAGNYTPEELDAQFGIDDLDTVDFAGRLKDQREKPWEETDPLFKELWRLQERRNFESRKRLVDGLRAHMETVGRVIPVCANVTNAGLFAFGDGHRFPGLKWNLLLDFLAFENGNAGEDFYEEAWPKAKWVAYERFAEAAYPLPSALLHLYGELHPWEMEFLGGGPNRSVYFQGMVAEANANGCHYVNYFQPRGLPASEPLWDPCFAMQKFVRDHRDLFEPESETGANVALLYIENEGLRYRTWSYLGAAQALAESQIPFDVVIDGGDGYVAATLTAAKLAPYPLVWVAHALELAPQQKEAIEGYAEGGGTVLTADPGAFELPEGEQVVDRGEGAFVVLEKADVPERGLQDAGTAYYLTYDDGLRRRIARVVNAYAEPVLAVEGLDRTACVYPRYQPDEKRIVVHLVNYDYVLDENRMRPKEGITVRVKKPDFYGDVRDARVYSPDVAGDARETTLTPQVDEGFIIFTVPRLDVYTVVVL